MWESDTEELYITRSTGTKFLESGDVKKLQTDHSAQNYI